MSNWCAPDNEEDEYIYPFDEKANWDRIKREFGHVPQEENSKTSPPTDFWDSRFVQSFRSPVKKTESDITEPTDYQGQDQEQIYQISADQDPFEDLTFSKSATYDIIDMMVNTSYNYSLRPYLKDGRLNHLYQGVEAIINELIFQGDPETCDTLLDAESAMEQIVDYMHAQRNNTSKQTDGPQDLDDYLAPTNRQI